MKLRMLELRDAPLMLEWMHDPDVVAQLQADFASKTLADCEKFIRYSQSCQEDLHMAIADEEDTYMGTASLKHLDRETGTAEFAITVRACAMGKGYSREGMAAILQKGLHDLGLKQIFWCVSRENARAVRFYDKCGYCRTQDVPPHILNRYTPAQNANFYWYVVS